MGCRCPHDLQVSILCCSKVICYNANHEIAGTSQTELTVAIMIASMPRFAGFMRLYVIESKLAMSVRSLLGNITRSGHRSTNQQSIEANMNQSPSGLNSRTRGRKATYFEMNETWLMNSQGVVDIEHQTNSLQPNHDANGVRVEKTFNVEQVSLARSEGSGKVHLLP